MCSFHLSDLDGLVRPSVSAETLVLQREPRSGLPQNGCCKRLPELRQVMFLGFRVQGLRFRVLVQGLWFRACSLGLIMYVGKLCSLGLGDLMGRGFSSIPPVPVSRV